jgi:hypothetical protein
METVMLAYVLAKRNKLWVTCFFIGFTCQKTDISNLGSALGSYAEKQKISEGRLITLTIK